MYKEKIDKIDCKIKEFEKQISDIKKKSNIKIKDLKAKIKKISNKKNSEFLKLIEGVPSSKVIEALKKI